MQDSKSRLFFPLLVAAAFIQQSPAKLTSADVLLPRIPDQADTSVVRRVLGPPDSIADSDDPSQAGPIPAWWYQDLTVVLRAGRELHGWWITGPTRTTHRGLRLGSSRDEVERLYGEPKNATGDSTLVYCEPHGGSVPRCMYLVLRHNQVRSIYIGRNID